MNVRALKSEVKRLARQSGAALVGVGVKSRLDAAVAAGVESADMEYVLPGARTCVIFAYACPYEVAEAYFAKRTRMPMKRFQHRAYSTAWRTAEAIAEFIEGHGDHAAHPVVPNGKYRRAGSFSNVVEQDVAYPPFSLRFGGVAAGLGHLGWSGNLVTAEHGGAVFLGGVVTTAPLPPDPVAPEKHCNGCKICAKACTTGYFSETEAEPTFTIGGVEQVYGKRGSYSRCGYGCAGFTGLSADGTWSTWTAGHVSLQAYSDAEWSQKNTRQQVMRQLLMDEMTPAAERAFHQRILREFSNITITENVGLRPLEETNPRCGNCSFICQPESRQRTRLFQLLKRSGKLYVDEAGREFVKREEDGQEVVFYPASELNASAGRPTDGTRDTDERARDAGARDSSARGGD